MFLHVILLDAILLLAIVGHSSAGTYELLVADEKIFSDCPNQAKGTLNQHGMFDLSDLNRSMNADGVNIAGSMTCAWNIQPEDRVEMSITLLYFDRGTWQSTVFSLVSKDFCKSMYDEKQYWYKFWTQHFTNSADVKDKCVLYPGTKLQLEPFMLSLRASTSGPFRNGRYKARIRFNAFDQSGASRLPNICFEIIGDIYKV
ncbi:uncharacterized protein LOC108156558 [Drosophila miranda]|uniref:uncharacterized protein LOC108156558 n=1 Tax=Drosophila miranda TaxID=7229 RepID=UPI0007E69480|nr:uncharacterized protein LOC108156558 [Drosophila miranda]